MPIKWTPENNELLLLKILETHDIKVDTALVAAAWPKDKGEQPTPRAITERLAKIRSNASVGGGAKLKMSIKSTPRTPVSTPRKPKAGMATFSSPRQFTAINAFMDKTPTKSANKRMRLSKEESEEPTMSEDDSDALVRGVTASELTALGNGIMEDPFIDHEHASTEGTTGRRPRRTIIKRELYGVDGLELGEQDNHGGHGYELGESDVSDFEAV